MPSQSISDSENDPVFVRPAADCVLIAVADTARIRDVKEIDLRHDASHAWCFLKSFQAWLDSFFLTMTVFFLRLRPLLCHFLIRPFPQNPMHRALQRGRVPKRAVVHR